MEMRRYTFEYRNDNGHEFFLISREIFKWIGDIPWFERSTMYGVINKDRFYTRDPLED